MIRKKKKIRLKTELTEMSALSDKDFKAAIIKMLHRDDNYTGNKWKKKKKSSHRGSEVNEPN